VHPKRRTGEAVVQKWVTLLGVISLYRVDNTQARCGKVEGAKLPPCDGNAAPDIATV